MRAVNLLPRDETKRTKTNVPVLVGVAGAVVVSAMLSMLFLSASAKVRDEQNQLDAINAQIAVIPLPPAPDTAGAGLATQEQARLTALSMLSSLRRELGDLDRVTAWLMIACFCSFSMSINCCRLRMNLRTSRSCCRT